MASWFYSDLWRRQNGPVSDSDLLQLNFSGEINAESLVWRDGMATWIPFINVASELFQATRASADVADKEQTPPPQIGVCAQTALVIEADKMLPYGSSLVSVEAKQDFVQTLMETGRVFVEQPAENEKKYVGFWLRFLAVIVDEMVKMVIIGVLVGAIAGVSALFFGGFAQLFERLDQFDQSISGLTLGLVLTALLFVTVFCPALYDVWMVYKYQATLGKMAIKAKVVNPDGSSISLMKSFGRWAAKNPVSMEIAKSVPIITIYAFVGLLVAGVAQGGPAFMVASWFLALVLPIVLSLAATAMFWMAAFDSEKRALHDRITGTRVIPTKHI